MPNFEMECGCFLRCECEGPSPGGLGHRGTPGYVIQEARAVAPADPRQEFHDALARAERADPGNTFVASLQRYFQERGCLSAKQIAALARVRPTRRRGGHLDYAGPPNSWSAGNHDDYGLAQSWDWAGGD